MKQAPPRKMTAQQRHARAVSDHDIITNINMTGNASDQSRLMKVDTIVITQHSQECSCCEDGEYHPAPFKAGEPLKSLVTRVQLGGVVAYLCSRCRAALKQLLV